MMTIQKKNFFKLVPTFLLSAFLLISPFFSDANKFDNARQIYLVLSFAFLGIIFWVFLFLKKKLNKKDNAASESGEEILKKICLLCFAIWTIISFFTSQTGNFGFTEVLMLCGAVLFFLFEKRFLDLKFLAIVSQIVLVFSSLGGYVLYLFSEHQRAFGFFYNPAIRTDAWPNAFAFLVLLVWPIFFQTFWKAKSHILLKSIFFSFIIAAFILSFSRAGFLACMFQISLLIGYGIFHWFKTGKGKIPFRKIFALGGVVFFACILIFSAQYGRSNYFQKKTLSFSEKAQFANNEQGTSIQERADFFQGAITLIQQEPIFGYGPMSFGYTYRAIQKDWLALADHPHNIFLKIGSESGLPAVFFFLVFIGLILKKAFLHMKKSASEEKFRLFILITAFLGALAHNLVDYNMNFATNFFIFWFLLKNIDEISTPEVHMVKKQLPLFRHISAVPFAVFMCLTLFLILKQSYATSQAFIARITRNESLLETTKIFENSLFPRFFFVEQGVDLAQQGNAEEAEKYFKKYLEKNRWDSGAYNSLGELYLKLSRFQEANSNFSQALKIDPKNTWRYYFNQFYVLQILKKDEERKALEQKIISEMRQYLPKVKANIHFTAQKSNSEEAVRVLDILIETGGENKSLFQQLKSEIQKARAIYNRK